MENNEIIFCVKYICAIVFKFPFQPQLNSLYIEKFLRDNPYKIYCRAEDTSTNINVLKSPKHQPEDFKLRVFEGYLSLTVDQGGPLHTHIFIYFSRGAD